MKKRILCGLMSVIMVLSMLVTLVFACVKPQNKTQVASASVEDELGEKIDLIGINTSGYANATIENITPFDSAKGEMMEGVSLVPNADAFGQVSSTSFNVGAFRLTANTSIYFWIYLLDTETFELTFTITDASNKSCRWFFDSSLVQAAGAGWSLFELKAADAETSELNTDRYSVDYQIFDIRYRTELTENIEQYLGITDEFLSIYHVYLSGSYNANPYSGRIAGLSKAYSAFKSSFFGDGRIFKGDEIELVNPYTIFNYLKIGKREYSQILDTSDYIWEITLQYPSGATAAVDFGDQLSFLSKGFYTINIKLYEKKKLLNQPVDLQTVLILNESRSVYCEEISLGSFIVGTTYELKDNEILEIGFKLTPGIVLTGELSFYFSNNCAELEAQYIENGIYYIQIKGLQKGDVELEISANASSQYNRDVRKYSVIASIEVLSSEEPQSFSITILWITFGCFCAFFAGMLINSLVKARKNDVK